MKLIVANWKMHGTPALAAQMQAALPKAPGAEVVLCPPAVLLPYFKAVTLGAQDCHAEREGAFTGDISAAMLKDAGCRYVIVGHSERRQQHGETDALISRKAATALDAGLIPIICIGETLAEREAGKAESVVETQLKACISALKGNFVLAYEPVWAIGSGRTPSSAEIKAMHAHIRKVSGGKAKVLYGGSVNAGNAKEILGIEGVDGALVGGASLKPDAFCEIINAAG